MDQKEVRKRVWAAYNLLQEDTTNKERLDSVAALLKGVNPKIDRLLSFTSKAYSDIEKIQKGEVIDLTAKYLPEKTEEEKKRKRVLLYFIKTWKQLKGEVERVKAEFEKTKDNSQYKNVQTAGRIISQAKGPFGIVTLVAVVLVGLVAYFNLVSREASKTKSEENVDTSQKSHIKVIDVKGKKIPLSQVRVGVGTECEGREHYHAISGNVAKATDGSDVFDPGGCGYGKVEDVKVEEINTSEEKE